MKHYLGIDIGGTSIKSGIVSEEGALLSQQKIPAPPDWESMLAAIEQLYREGTEEVGAIEGIGLATPGISNPHTGIISGIVAQSVNYILGKCFFDLSDMLGVPVSLEQDANSAALGEYWVGNAAHTSSCVVLVLGTGLGGSILFDGRVHHGAHIFGGDIGYAYRTHRLDVHSFSWNIAPVYVEMQYKQRTGQFLTIPQMFEARLTDPEAADIYDNFIGSLANAVYLMQYIIDPEVVLIGGGISDWDLLIPETERRLAELKGLRESPLLPQVRRCKFGNSANILGAVYNLKQMKKI